MRAIVLDIFTERSGSICYLSKATLKDYIQSLPHNYNDYDVQREIVGHIYLDNLVNSLLEGKHIPPIVLITENAQTFKTGDNADLGNDFKILDGLQRTYRLKYLYETIQFFLGKDFKIDFEGKSKLRLSKEFKGELFEINSNVSVLSKLIDYAAKNQNYTNYFESLFERFQWFEVWQNLTPQDEVNKMLILNAGHKAVSPKHQIELLFNSSLPTLRKLANSQASEFTIVREKEKASIRFSKERKKGEFHLSHLITGLLSYYEGKALTSNIDLIQNQQNNTDYAQKEVFLNSRLLQLFLNTLISLDNALINIFQDQGVKWLGREISIVGMFGALGSYKIKSEITDDQAFDKFSDLIIRRAKVLNINAFESERNSQTLSKINIGNVNKKAVYGATLDILENKITGVLDWEGYFKGGPNDN